MKKNIIIDDTENEIEESKYYKKGDPLYKCSLCDENMIDNDRISKLKIVFLFFFVASLLIDYNIERRTC